MTSMLPFVRYLHRNLRKFCKLKIPVHGREGWCCLMCTNDNRVCGCDVWQYPTGHLSSALDVPGLLTTPCLRLETSQNGVLPGQGLHGSPLDRKSTRENKSMCISGVWPVRKVNKGSTF